MRSRPPTADDSGRGPSFPHFLDTGIVQKNMNAHHSGSPQTYASALATRITVSAHLASSVSTGTY